MRVAALASLAAAALIAGCGADESTTSSGPKPPAPGPAGASSVPPGAVTHRCATRGRLTGLRVSGVGCAEGRAVMSAWGERSCRPAGGDSRSACTVRRYRCLAVVAGRGISVGCARPGRSISFLRRR